MEIWGRYIELSSITLWVDINKLVIEVTQTKLLRCQIDRKIGSVTRQLVPISWRANQSKVPALHDGITIQVSKARAKNTL